MGNDQKKKKASKTRKCVVMFRNGIHHLPMIPQENRAVPWLMVGGLFCRKRKKFDEKYASRL